MEISCRRYKDMQLASFCAALQVFAANDGNKRNYLYIIPQLARSLDISDVLAIEYAKRYLTSKRYKLVEALANTQDSIDEEILKTLDDFFIPKVDSAPKPILSEGAWGQLDPEYMKETLGEGPWDELTGFLVNGGTTTRAKEIREKLRLSGLEASQK